MQDTTDTIQSKMAKARSDAKLTEVKLKKVNEQIHYLGQYLSTKSVYADFLKSTRKKNFRQNHADEITKYEEALQFLKQSSPDENFPTMKDLRSEKELLIQQKNAQYETYPLRNKNQIINFKNLIRGATSLTQFVHKCQR